MKDSISITLVQSDILWKNIPENLSRYEKIISNLSSTDLIVLPEMFATGFITDPKTVVDEQNKVINWLVNISNKTGFSIIGSHPFNENSVFYNRLFFVKPFAPISHYDKRHLFGFGGEKESYKQGSQRMISLMKDWKIMSLICYDLRFPVWSRNTDGYEILIYIANWPSNRQTIWETLLRARAIENQCYVVGVNRIGEDCNNIRYSGQSMILSPDGSTLKSMGNEEGVLQFDFSSEKLLDFREKFPFLQDIDEFEIIKNPAKPE